VAAQFGEKRRVHQKRTTPFQGDSCGINTLKRRIDRKGLSARKGLHHFMEESARIELPEKTSKIGERGGFLF